jgi:hypothetical protein
VTSIFGGFSLYGAVEDVQMLLYGQSQQSILSLNDVEFRRLLKFKRAQNVSNHAVGEIDVALYEIYGDQVVMDDNKDMTMTYFFPTGDQRFATILSSEDALPRPAGVDADIVLI